MTSELSFCAIVKNEEKLLPDMLESIASIADEIIITDTGSTDNTIKIAKDFGAKVFEYSWNNNFADVRNFTTKQATKDWIFSIDADERLIYPENVRKYLNVENTTYFIKIFSIKDISEYDGKNRYIYNIKVFPNVDDLEFIYPIHEHLNSINELKYDNLLMPDVHLLHYGYDLSTELMKLKHERNTNMIIEELEKNNLKYKYYFNFLLAREYLAQFKFEEAIKYLHLALDDPYIKWPMNVNAVTNLLESYYMIEDWNNLELTFKKYNKLGLTNPDFCLFYGLYLDKVCNRSNEAIFYYYRLLKFKEEENPYIIFDYASITWKPLSLIGLIYLKKKDFKRGIDYLNQALVYNPNDHSISYNLIMAYLNNDEKILANEVFKSYKKYFSEDKIIYLNNILN